ncbi:hypothetical protein C492_09410 [Natronococcus jeotgali DSM 18795]|uniref:Uncharacterized protein n=1 Tax=Natronococcus jeotgali DSM 18795 TaxID=1227498 RepID=L9XIH1_9EURY|nr:hypothetical protein C492_09410 [Natronococcus jeotgali DSM 18795]
MFEVESTTSIYSGILRMTDFVTRVPIFAVDMNLVAAESTFDMVRKEMIRLAFETFLSLFLRVLCISSTAAFILGLRSEGVFRF